MKIVECVPNFSEGRDKEKICKITDKIEKTENVWLLDVYTGAATNRTVVTFAGTPRGVTNAAFKAIKKAAELINLQEHGGEHPRIGATDVCPFVPVENVSMEECVQIANKLGKKVAEKLGIPVYLYEKAATEDKRKNLSNIRRGEYENLREKIKDPDWKPDYGEPLFNEKSGATVIGARNFLIAYNVNLNTKDKKIAQTIAEKIRESGTLIENDNGSKKRIPGKLKKTKAIGWYVDEYGAAQVSLNLTDYRITPPHKAFEEIRKEASKLKVRVTGSEVVGLIPREAIIMAGKYYLEKQGKSKGVPEKEIIFNAIRSLGLNEVTEFIPSHKIIEYRISEIKDSLMNKSIKIFTENLSSSSSTPGGGSVSALAGSLAAALGAMVGNLTFGKDKYKKYQNEIETLTEDLQSLRYDLLNLGDDDIEAFKKLMNAFRMKKTTEKEKKVRAEAIQSTVKIAIKVPLEVMRKSLDIIKIAERIAEIGNVNVISDAGISAEMAYSSCHSASWNVKVNLPFLKDEEIKSRIKKEHDEIINEVDDKLYNVREIVEEKL